jgi:hypothetical protein
MEHSLLPYHAMGISNHSGSVEQEYEEFPLKYDYRYDYYYQHYYPPVSVVPAVVPSPIANITAPMGRASEDHEPSSQTSQDLSHSSSSGDKKKSKAKEPDSDSRRKRFLERNRIAGKYMERQRLAC